MSTGDDSARLVDEIARLEAVAHSLETDDLTPAEIRDLADEALVIAQRVAALLAEAREHRPGEGAAGAAAPAPQPGD